MDAFGFLIKHIRTVDGHEWGFSRRERYKGSLRTYRATRPGLHLEVDVAKDPVYRPPFDLIAHSNREYACNHKGSDDFEAQKHNWLPLPDDYRNFFGSDECLELALAI